MKTTDHAPIIAIAMLAARADGSVDSAEQRAVDAVVTRTGNPDFTRLAQQVASGQLRVAGLASGLSDDEARRAAYEGALAIVNADGSANTSEQAFLDELRTALGLSDANVAEATHMAASLAAAPVAGAHTGQPSAGPVDDFILQQSILTGAIEVLPDRLANLAVLPLQLRMVYQIGQRHGQKLDIDQDRHRRHLHVLGDLRSGPRGGAVLRARAQAQRGRFAGAVRPLPGRSEDDLSANTGADPFTGRHTEPAEPAA